MSRVPSADCAGENRTGMAWMPAMKLDAIRSIGPR
jgi:hypothetical protein